MFNERLYVNRNTFTKLNFSNRFGNMCKSFIKVKWALTTNLLLLVFDNITKIQIRVTIFFADRNKSGLCCQIRLFVTENHCSELCWKWTKMARQDGLGQDHTESCEICQPFLTKEINSKQILGSTIANIRDCNWPNLESKIFGNFLVSAWGLHIWLLAIHLVIIWKKFNENEKASRNWQLN